MAFFLPSAREYTVRMNPRNPFEDPVMYSVRHEAHEFVERALRGEHLETPAHLKNDEEFKSALGEKIASLLYRELDESAEHVVENLKIPHSVIHSDTVHSAAIRELTHLEESFVENLPAIRKLMEIFELTEDDVPGELRNLLKKNLPHT